MDQTFNLFYFCSSTNVSLKGVFKEMLKGDEDIFKAVSTDPECLQNVNGSAVKMFESEPKGTEKLRGKSVHMWTKTFLQNIRTSIYL